MSTAAALKAPDDSESFEALLEDYRGQVDAMRKSQAVIEFALDGTVLDANDHFLNAVGYSLAEVRGKHHSLFVDPAEQASPAYRAFWERLGRGEHDAGQYRRIGKGGREVWIQASYNPVMDAAGKPVKVVKFATDVTRIVEERQAGLRVQRAADNLSSSVMTVDRDLIITYVNESTKALLKGIAPQVRQLWSDFDPDRIVGVCIDRFHKDPSHQRRLLADPSRMQYKTDIRLGGLIIHLCVNATYDEQGNHVGNSLEWANVTEIRAAEALNTDLANQMAAISKAQAVIEFTMDGRVVTANPNFLKTLGYALDEIQSQHHSMFLAPAERNTPEYRAFWEKLNRGEHESSQYKRIAKDGSEVWIQASYNPICDASGKPMKVMKYASDITLQRKVAERVKEISNIVSSASTEMRATAEAMAQTAAEATTQAAAVASAAQVASSNVQTVSAAGEELSASISEIARQVAESTNITQRAVSETDTTKAAIQTLAEAAQKIGNVVTLINNIAGQTKLLALNATIEAARAGDAGKGFAVVASEVKSLSDQTAKATHEISSEVSAMQAATSTSVSAIQGIADTIGKVAEIAAAIASAVEEQSAATGEISANVTEAAASTQEVSSNIQGLNEGVAQTSAASAQLLTASGELAVQAEALSREMDGLL
ncbi:MAG: PAS domain S-box protein [Brevundimonas sp.]|nr:PAS domain S-box protein [Brevundimonas sp.]